MSTSSPRVIIVMGASNVESTTFGSALAAALGWRFEDAGASEKNEQPDELRQLVEQALRDEAGLVLVCPPPSPATQSDWGVQQAGVALVQLTAPNKSSFQGSSAALQLDLTTPIPQLVRDIREQLVI